MVEIATDTRVNLKTLKQNNGSANQLTFEFAPDTPGVTAYPIGTWITYTYNGKTWFYGQVARIKYGLKNRVLEHQCLGHEKIYEENPWTAANRKYNGEVDGLCPNGALTGQTVSQVFTAETAGLAPFFSVSLLNNVGAAQAAEVTTEGRSPIKFAQDVVKRVPGARWTIEYPLNGGIPTLIFYDATFGRTGHALNVDTSDQVIDVDLVYDGSETATTLIAKGKGRYDPQIAEIPVTPYSHDPDATCCDTYREEVKSSSWRPSHDGGGGTSWDCISCTIEYVCVRIEERTDNTTPDVLHGSATIIDEVRGDGVGAVACPTEPGDFQPSPGSTYYKYEYNSKDIANSTQNYEEITFAQANALITGWKACAEANAEDSAPYSRTENKQTVIKCDTGRVGDVAIPAFPNPGASSAIYPFWEMAESNLGAVMRVWSAPEPAPDDKITPPNPVGAASFRETGQVETVANSVGIKYTYDEDAIAILLKDNAKFNVGDPPNPPNHPVVHLLWSVVSDFQRSAIASGPALAGTKVFVHDSIYSLGDPDGAAGDKYIVGEEVQTLQQLADDYENMYGSAYWGGSVSVALNCNASVYECPYKVGDTLVLNGCLGDADGASGIIESLDLSKMEDGQVTISLGRRESRSSPFARPEPLVADIEGYASGVGTNRHGEDKL